jgi:molecular chaperone HtpG
LENRAKPIIYSTAPSIIDTAIAYHSLKYILKHKLKLKTKINQYQKIIKDTQTDKDGKLIYLYATDKDAQYKFIKDAQDKGYDVLLFDGAFDIPFINMYEPKLENSHFARVDSDTIDNLIKKDDKKEISINENDRKDLETIFEAAAPEKVGTYFVQFNELSADEMPVIITQSEYMRRMKDIGMMGGPEVSLYNNLPDNYNLVVNTAHQLIKQINDDKNQELGEKINDLNEKIQNIQKEIDAIDKLTKDKKEEEISQEEKDKKQKLEEDKQKHEAEKTKILKEWGMKNKLVKQVIDLALLAKNLLKGENLMNFVKRSVDFIEK